MTERVFILGAGQVGRGLSRAFRASGIDVLGLHGRTNSGFATSSGPLPPTIGNANCILVAVRDEQIDDALAELMSDRGRGSRGRVASGSVVLHTSGSAEPELLRELPGYGLSGGTFHPMIPFAHPERTAELLRHGWIGIDGDDQARAASRRIAGHLGARTLEIPPGGKGAYHAAAVISSNFPVVLAAIANDLLVSVGIPERSAQQAVHSLMDAAVSNLSDTAPVDALTGPVVRGDLAAVKQHLAALRANPDARAIYKRISLAALSIAASKGVDTETLQEMERVLLLR